MGWVPSRTRTDDIQNHKRLKESKDAEDKHYDEDMLQWHLRLYYVFRWMAKCLDCNFPFPYAELL